MLLHAKLNGANAGCGAIESHSTLLAPSLALTLHEGVADPGHFFRKAP